MKEDAFFVCHSTWKDASRGLGQQGTTVGTTVTFVVLILTMFPPMSV